MIKYMPVISIMGILVILSAKQSADLIVNLPQNVSTKHFQTGTADHYLPFFWLTDYIKTV
jgi:hypothetical protein